MFSPQDRIYNTPDISAPAAEAILQQIRLERILKRFGYFACSKPSTTQPNKGVEPPLVNLGPPPPTRGLRPFGAHEVFTGWQKSNNVQISLPQKCNKSPRATIPGAPRDDPFLQKTRDTIGGGKYGGVHLSKYGLKPEARRADIFKPFQPQKSPLRLPAIQRERNRDSEVKDELLLIDKEINKHVRLHRKDDGFNRKQRLEQKSKRKRQMEKEFLKWEENHASYYRHPVDSLYEAEHKITGERNAAADEQSYRDRIAAGIRQGIKDRVESFGQGGQFATGCTACTTKIPIKDVKFGCDEEKKIEKPRLFSTSMWYSLEDWPGRHSQQGAAEGCAR
ncbi:hypothetical protein ACF0H5_003604 [Mactra antiquata]